MATYNRIILLMFGVLSLATIWSDASIDKALLQNTHSETETKIYDEKTCMRKCTFRQKPRQCHYTFVVDATEGLNNSFALTINGQSPGPAIHACINDVIIVEITNRLYGQELAFHWHGLDQKGTPYMDGVPMITQCPITGGTKFKYAFRAGEVGTYFYHAHSVAHHADGLYGSLIISQPHPFKRTSSCHIYDEDRSHEHTLLVSASFPVAFTNNFDDLRGVRPTQLLINGDENFRIHVQGMLKYRIRVINAIPVECPLVVNVDGHEIVVIATDGREVEPTTLERVLIYPGERTDFVLKTNRPPSSYWLRVEGFGICSGLHQRSFVVYNELNYTSVKPLAHHLPKMSSFLPHGTVSGQYLVAPNLERPLAPKADLNVVLSLDTNEIMVNDDDSDFRYLSDALPVPPFYPSQISRSNDSPRVIQINGKNFLYPNAPILTVPNSMPRRTVCPVGYERNTEDVECLQVINLESKQSLELIIIDKGLGSNTSKTFHMHGNPMYVLASSRKSNDRSISVEEVEQLDRDLQIKRNLINPPRKDTITVPNKGYVAVRIIADNPGSWLFECRSCSLSSLPAAILIQVPSQIPKVVIDSMPKCGNFRPPDILMN